MVSIRVQVQRCMSTLTVSADVQISKMLNLHFQSHNEVNDKYYQTRASTNDISQVYIFHEVNQLNT